MDQRCLITVIVIFFKFIESTPTPLFTYQETNITLNETYDYDFTTNYETSKLDLTDECNVCMSESCVNAAHIILKNMDPTVEPCDDFYQFSCGNYLKQRTIPDSDLLTSSFTDLNLKLSHQMINLLVKEETNNDDENQKYIINAKNYYLSCMNEDYVEEHGRVNFLNFIDNFFGGWLLINNTKWDSSKMENFFKIYESEKLEPFLTDDEFKSKKVLKGYRRFVYDIAILLNPNISDLKKLKADIELMVWLEKIMRQSGYTRIKFEEFRKKDFHKLFNVKKRIKRDELDLKEFDTFSLNETEKSLSNNINNDTIFAFKESLENMTNQINSLLVWHFIRTNVQYLPIKFQYAKLNFDKVLFETKSLVPREKMCMDEISAKMPLVLAKLYYKYQKVDEKSYFNLIEKLKDVAIKEIKNLKWMDSHSKNLTVQIMQNLKFTLANSYFMDDNIDSLKNSTLILELLYQNYTFNQIDYFENEIHRLLVRNKKVSENILNGLSDSPIDVNALLDLLENKMIFSPSLLVEPFFDINRPNYLNFAQLGYIIGHEIMHGMEFMDEDFCINDCWSNETQTNFNDLSKCFIKQYDSYLLKEVNRKLDGKKTFERKHS